MTVGEAYQQNLLRIQRACEAAKRDPASVRLIAVSKTKTAAQVLEAYQAGCRDFGENYVQELVEKAPALPSDIRWHFIGHLQSNKAKKVLPHVSLLHTLDSVKLAKILQESAKNTGALLQVNIGREPQKAGVMPEDVIPLLQELAKISFWVSGLMCIPPVLDDPEGSRPHFAHLQKLQKQAQDALGRPLPELSMGMTGDAEVAIQEGATMVRIGTAIFGERS